MTARQGKGPTLARRRRMAEALRLRERGATYPEIADETGVSLRQAWEDVQYAVREVAQDRDEDTLALELLRLDHLFAIAYERAETDGDPQAVNAALRVMERRARYLGLDQLQTEDGTRAVGALLAVLLDGTPAADTL